MAQTTGPKLDREVEKELLTTFEAQLLEKEHSGAAALLRDEKVEDLARMFKLFQRVPKGLDPISAIFKKHVESDGMTQARERTPRGVIRSAAAD